jgi:hypothetical protein
MEMINNSLKNIGFTFKGKWAYLKYNHQIVRWISISNLRYGRTEAPTLGEKRLWKSALFLENNDFLFQLFLWCALNHHQYIRWLRQISDILPSPLKHIFSERIKLTKGDVIYTLEEALDAKPLWGASGEQIIGWKATFLTNAGKEEELFRKHYRDFNPGFESKGADYFLSDEEKSIFFENLKLNQEDQQDEALILGLLCNNISKRRFLGTLRTRSFLAKQLPRAKRQYCRKSITFIKSDGREWETSISKEAVIISYLDKDKKKKLIEIIGYQISTEEDITLDRFELLKLKKDDEINFVECCWYDPIERRSGVFCPLYIRSRLGGLA